MDEATHVDTTSTRAATEPVEPAVDANERARIVHSTGGTGRPATQRALDPRGVTWMRISDAVASGSGRVAGRGLSLGIDVARRIRHPVAVTRHAIRERSHRLPPISEFGGNRRPRSIRRDALNRS